jgi:SAM-dependent methyltransferase
MTDIVSALETTQDFWERFYSTRKLTHEPSPFCEWFQNEYLKAPATLIELGCGNARDAFAFVKNGHSVIAVDRCPVAIKNNIDFLRTHAIPGKIHFLNECFARLDNLFSLETTGQPEIVYTRFVLHAVTEDLEDKIIDYAYKALPSGGLMAHEFRTDKDPLSSKGELLSSNERLTDHYRRFINLDSFRSKLDSGKWSFDYCVESHGWARFGREDPCVARVIVRKI